MEFISQKKLNIVPHMTTISSVNSAIEIGLFEFLNKQGNPCSIEEISNSLSLNCPKRNLMDFLDVLASEGHLERLGVGPESKYSNAHKNFLAENPDNVIAYVKFQFTSIKRYFDLSEILKSGKRPNSTDIFNDFYKNPDETRAFLRSMARIQKNTFSFIAQQEDLSKVKRVLDVGGCLGNFLEVIKKKYGDGIECINYDLKEVEPYFHEYMHEVGLTGKIQFQAGSFRKEDLPGNFDCIMLGNILHDWNEETKNMILDKVFKSLNPGGLLIIAESFTDESRKNFNLLMYSYLMLVECVQGFEFTPSELDGYLKQKGFVNLKVHQDADADVYYAVASKPL